MGRPREHDAGTGSALLDAAERIVEAEGIGGLSVRRAAADAGTTTRAVYTVFGSKEGLVVALGRRAFDWLASAIDALPVLDDPVDDLAEAGVRVFRRLVLDHPVLFTIGVQHRDVPPELAAQFRAEAHRAMGRLLDRVGRLHEVGLLERRRVKEAAMEFHALCEGLAALELRGVIIGDRAERIWREALTALLAGLTGTGHVAVTPGG